MSETTGSFRAYMANGGKKTVGKIGAAGALSLGGLLVLLHSSPTLLPYVTAAEFKDTTASVVEVKTEVRNIRSEMSEFKSEMREETHETQTLVRQLLVAQGIRPAIPDTPSRVDTVFMQIVNQADSGNSRPR